MDATRSRRTRDRARQSWYARHRERRFARFLGFAEDVRTPSWGRIRIGWAASTGCSGRDRSHLASVLAHGCR